MADKELASAFLMATMIKTTPHTDMNASNWLFQAGLLTGTVGELGVPFSGLGFVRRVVLIVAGVQYLNVKDNNLPGV
jgi:hypothetical protein